MGETLKRKKAQAFQHQQDERYDEFCAPDLISEARGAVLQNEYDAVSIVADGGAPVGATVQLRVEGDGSIGVVHRTTLIGHVHSQSIGELRAALEHNVARYDAHLRAAIEHVRAQIANTERSRSASRQRSRSASEPRSQLTLAL